MGQLHCCDARKVVLVEPPCRFTFCLDIAVWRDEFANDAVEVANDSLQNDVGQRAFDTAAEFMLALSEYSFSLVAVQDGKCVGVIVCEFSESCGKVLYIRYLVVRPGPHRDLIGLMLVRASLMRAAHAKAKHACGMIIEGVSWLEGIAKSLNFDVERTDSTRCKRCDGDGKAGMIFGIAGMGVCRTTCSKCHGTGQVPDEIIYGRRLEVSPEHVPIGNMIALTPDNAQHLASLDSSNLPLRYDKRFYDLLLLHPELCRLLEINGHMAGGVSARPVIARDGTTNWYIANLAVDKTFRRHGVAETLIRFILRAAAERHDVHGIYAHTQISNAPILSLALKLGFELVGALGDYYSGLDEGDAYVLFKSNTTSSQSIRRLSCEELDEFIDSPMPGTPEALCVQKMWRGFQARRQRHSFQFSVYREFIDVTDMPGFSFQVLQSVDDFLQQLSRQDNTSDSGQFKKMFCALVSELQTRDFVEAKYSPSASKDMFQAMNVAAVCWTAAGLPCPNGISTLAEIDGNEREFSWMVNYALRTNCRGLVSPLMPFVKALNRFCAEERLRAIPSVRWPQNNKLYRGGGFNLKHKAFFRPGRTYRCAGFLSSTPDLRIARLFMRRAEHNGFAPVLWTIRIDPQYGCWHVNYLSRSLVHAAGSPTEAEYLFSPFSAFTVTASNWKSNPTWMQPHEVELRAAPDNKTMPLDLPTAPWQ